MNTINIVTLTTGRNSTLTLKNKIKFRYESRVGEAWKQWAGLTVLKLHSIRTDSQRLCHQTFVVWVKGLAT